MDFKAAFTKKYFSNICLSAFFSTSFFTEAAQMQQLESSGIRYDTYEVYETNVKSAAVLVDFKMVEADCHGLDYAYVVKKIEKNKFLVSKQMLLKPMVTCPTTETMKLQTGVKIDLAVEKGFAGTVTQAEVIVPTESEVVMQVER